MPVALAASPAKTRRVDVSSSGKQALGGYSYGPTGEAISANGRFIAFSSSATNLVKGDDNGDFDAFVHDLKSGKTFRISVSKPGGDANGNTFGVSISADGRFVAFASDASNLVSGDSNASQDVFVRDLKTHQTRLVSVSSSGQQGNNASFHPSISADGRFIAFLSQATNLVPGGTSNTQVFVHDMKTGRTLLVSRSSSGQKANGFSVDPSMAGDGRSVAFASVADNLVSGDTNGREDVFVHNLKTKTTRLVSVSSSGQQGNDESITPSVSATGRFIVFASFASNLVASDANGGTADVFVRDLKTHKTRLVSLNSSGQQGNNASFLIDPAITPDGRFIVFTSFASNLVRGGTSGEQVFWRDLKRGKTQLVSQSSSGHKGHPGSFDASITADGSLVAFNSIATNLVPGDTNGNADVFVRGPLR